MMSGDWRVELLFTGYDSEDYEPQQAITGAYKIVNTRINAAEATRASYTPYAYPCVTSPGIEDLEV